MENPDGIRAASSAAETFLRYSYDSTPAAVRFKNESYKAVSYGFPIEALDKDEDIKDVIRGALNYIEL